MTIDFGKLVVETTSIFYLNTFTQSLSCLFPSTHLHFMAATSLILAVLYFSHRQRRTYLIDFSCYRAPGCCRAPLSSYTELFEISNRFDDECIEFQVKVLERSGLGNETSVPIGILQFPPDLSLASTLLEVETVLFTVTEDLLSKHSINPEAIDILILNCCLFCPTPSMAAMVIKKFGFRSNILSFNISGMGCSAGILAISLARDLLKVHKNSLALVLSMETITPFGYPGKVKSMLLTNCLFRMGGAAILLSNKKWDKKLAKYELGPLIRTDLGSDDKSYTAIVQEQDGEGFVGVALSRGILAVARDALKMNIRSLAPFVMPCSELFRYGWSEIQKNLWKPVRKKEDNVPNLKTAFEHFCIHAGGRAMIEAIEKNLGLGEEDMEASKMALYRFGNTSSSSIWYALSYLEAKGKVKKGDRVWQVSFGSGFMCNSCVWKCVSNLDTRVKNAWSDRIHMYPVEVPDVLDH